MQDPHNLDDYLKYNPFLPDINNEHDDKNPQYAANLASLDKLVLFRFSDDTVGECSQRMNPLPIWPDATALAIFACTPKCCFNDMYETFVLQH